jgi:hypothetical protein
MKRGTDLEETPPLKSGNVCVLVREIRGGGGGGGKTHTAVYDLPRCVAFF